MRSPNLYIPGVWVGVKTWPPARTILTIAN